MEKDKQINDVDPGASSVRDGFGVNEARTVAKIGAKLTHEDSRKVLAKLADNYETADPSCKGSLGLYLRRAHARLSPVNAEHGTEK